VRIGGGNQRGGCSFIGVISKEFCNGEGPLLLVVRRLHDITAAYIGLSVIGVTFVCGKVDLSEELLLVVLEFSDHNHDGFVL
jgi:hypothetical protein